MQKEHDDANRTLIVFAIVAIVGLLFGGMLGFVIKSVLPTTKENLSSQHIIGDNTVYMLPTMDAFSNSDMIALVPGLSGNYSHTSFTAFDENARMYFVTVFFPSSSSDMSLVTIHQFSIGDPRLISSVRYMGELTGKVYVWYANSGCWILAPYKNYMSPPAGCVF